MSAKEMRSVCEVLMSIYEKIVDTEALQVTRMVPNCCNLEMI